MPRAGLCCYGLLVALIDLVHDNVQVVFVGGDSMQVGIHTCVNDLHQCNCCKGLGIMYTCSCRE